MKIIVRKSTGEEAVFPFDPKTINSDEDRFFLPAKAGSLGYQLNGTTGAIVASSLAALVLHLPQN